MNLNFKVTQNLTGFGRNRNRGCVFIYVREDIPSRQLKIHNTPENIESIFIEINLIKTKWLFCGCYHPPSQSDQYFFENIGKTLDKYSKHYDNFMLVGDFNAEESEPCLSQFLYEYNAKNIVKENTFLKNAMNPSCIDLFIANSPLSFQNTITVSNGLSDFHKIVITVMKMSFKKQSPIERHYTDYKSFDRTRIKDNLNEKLSECIPNYGSFKTAFIEVLNKHAPLRKKFLRANHAPYIAKTLRKAIILGLNLSQNISKRKLKPTSNYIKNIKTFVLIYKKGKKRKYYESLDMKNVLDSKEFWKTVRPFLSDKNTVFSQISIEKNNRIISDDLNLSEEFSAFFEDAVRSLNVCQAR